MCANAYVVCYSCLQLSSFSRTNNAGDSILGSLKAGATLKKVDPPPEPKIDERTHLLRSIQLGSVQLKSAGAGAAKAKPFQKIDVKVQCVCSAACV